MIEQAPKTATTTPLEAALDYRRRSWAVIPVGNDKRPVEVAQGRRFPWEEFQHRLPTEGEVRGWYFRFPDAGVAVVCGVISHLVVLDIDPRHGGNESLEKLVVQDHQLPDTPLSKTGGGGTHFYFWTANEVPTRPALYPGVDLKGAGSYVVAPPSTHPSGGLYSWLVAPGMAELAPLPGWLMDLIQQHQGTRAAAAPEGEAGRYGAAWRLLSAAIPSGQRNAGLTRLGGWLRLYHPLPVVRALLLAVNDARCNPPLEVGEVERIAVSVCRYPQPGVNGHPLAVVPTFQREVSDA